MKVAILYSGHLRTWDRCKVNHERYLYTNETDLYFYTYDHPENTNYKQFIKIPNTYYNYEIHDFDSNRNPITSPPNTIQSWHNLFINFCLVPDNYDCYVKNRCDIEFNSSIKFSDFEMNDSNIYIPVGNDHCGGVNDQFAFGNYNVMKKYYSIYLEYPRLFSDGLVFHTEYYVTQNLLRKGVNIIRTKQSNHIVRCE